MALTLRALNSEAVTNSYLVISSHDFMPGETLTLNFQVFDYIQHHRHIPPTTAVTTLSFNTISGAALDKTATVNADDRSFLTVSLTLAEVNDLMGGNVKFSIDVLGDGTKIVKGIAQNMLRKVTNE